MGISALLFACWEVFLFMNGYELKPNLDDIRVVSERTIMEQMGHFVCDIAVDKICTKKDMAFLQKKEFYF
jgi:hypothetical protein